MRTLAVATALYLAMGCAWASGKPKIVFAIPSEDISTALIAFYHQSGMEILSATVGDSLNAKTHAIKGEFEPAEALTRMLEGTGYTFQIEEGFIWLTRDRSSGGSARPEMPEAPLTVDIGNSPYEKIPEVVVTGSLIRGMDSITAPVFVLGEKEKKQAAYASVQDVLRTLPLSFGGETEETPSATNFSRGASINLRGLGTGATLVLVNGRRQPTSGIDGDFVDVSAIPWSMVQRIEVLSDGASALYGSDAIAGVVNIILRDELSGGETQARLGTAPGGADESLIAQTFGHHWETGRWLAAYQYTNRTALPTANRIYAASGDKRPFGGSDLRTFWSNPGNILDPNTRLPAFAIPPGQDGKSLTPGELLSGTINLQNEFDVYDLLPNSRSHNVFLAASQKIGERVEIFAEARYANRHMSAQERAFDIVLPVPATNAFFVDPFGGSQSVFVGYNFLHDLGIVYNTSDTRTYTGTLGVKIDLGHDWQGTFSGYDGKQSLFWTGYNLIDRFALLAALADSNPATAFNPFGAGSHTNPATLEAIRMVQHEDPTSEIKTISLVADGPLPSLPAGIARLAMGLESRWETFSRRESFNDLVTHSGFGRSASAAFAELSLPVLSRFDLSLAARYEAYSDFGKTFNPKLGMHWSLLDSLRFRGSWGTSFRAPKLADVYDHSQDYAFLAPSVDPRSPNGYSVVLLESGTNPNLHEERAKTWTIGIDFTPPVLAGLTLSSTYYSINYRDRVWHQPPQTTADFLADPQWTPLVNRNPTQAEINAICSSSRFFGSPSDCTLNPPNVILDTRVRNLSTTVANGVDVEIKQTLQTHYGTIGLNLSGSRTLSFKQSITPTAPATDLLGTVGNPPALQLRGTAEWSRHGFNQPGPGASLTVDHHASLRDPAGPPLTHIDDQTTFDIQLNYRTAMNDRWLGNVEATLNVVNLFSEDPPFVNRIFGYDAVNATPYGRVISLSVQKNW